MVWTKEKKSQYNKEYYQKNREKIKVYKVNRKEYCKKWYKENSKKVKENAKKWKKNNPEKAKESSKKWRKNNSDKANERTGQWRKENPEYQKEYIKKRIKSDINFRLSCNLRNRLSNALKRNQKSGSAILDLGCSVNYLKKYLKNQFTKEMNWENYGQWEIDHQIPLSIVDLTDREDLKQVCHYTNLQPMWAEDNIRKGNLIIR